MMYSPFRRTQLSKVNRLKLSTTDSGFGLVETIVSSAILATIIITSISLITQLQNSRYNSSLRDATRTLIDEDIEILKQHFFSVHYVSTSSSKCFQTNSECSTSFPAQLLNQRGTNDASYVSSTVPGGPRSLLVKNSSVSSVFTGSPFEIQRVLSSHRPSISAGRYINSDSTIVRATYTLISTTPRSAGLSSNSTREILRVVDLYPDAHSYCNPE